MTTTARLATARIATITAAAELVISGFDTCELCSIPAAELFWRLDEDGAEVHVCERCADTVNLGCIDCD